MRWNVVEMADEGNDPDEGEKNKADHDVKHGDGVEVAVGIEIGVDGERGAVEENEENGAAEPSHLGAEKAEGFLALFGSEPVGFVGKIEALGRFRREDDRRDKSHEGGNADDDEHQDEENFLRLEAISSAIGRKVRGHHRRKLRVDTGPLQKTERQHEEVDQFRKARIVHRSG